MEDVLDVLERIDGNELSGDGGNGPGGAAGVGKTFFAEMRHKPSELLKNGSERLENTPLSQRTHPVQWRGNEDGKGADHHFVKITCSSYSIL